MIGVRTFEFPRASWLQGRTISYHNDSARDLCRSGVDCVPGTPGGLGETPSCGSISSRSDQRSYTLFDSGRRGDRLESSFWLNPEVLESGAKSPVASDKEKHDYPEKIFADGHRTSRWHSFSGPKNLGYLLNNPRLNPCLESHLPNKAGVGSNVWILEKRNGLSVHQERHILQKKDRFPVGFSPSVKTGYESPVECRQVPAPPSFLAGQPRLKCQGVIVPKEEAKVTKAGFLRSGVITSSSDNLGTNFIW